MVVPRIIRRPYAQGAIGQPWTSPHNSRRSCGRSPIAGQTEARSPVVFSALYERDRLAPFYAGLGIIVLGGVLLKPLLDVEEVTPCHGGHGGASVGNATSRDEQMEAFILKEKSFGRGDY